MARGLWSALKDSYRNRLIKKGITESFYNSGGSLQVARGHGQTPEHPEDAFKGGKANEKYAGYRFRKAQKEAVKKRKTAVQRAKDYMNLPKWQREKPYWPNNEESVFWKEYQRLGGVGKVA